MKGWSEIRIGDLGEVITGSTPPTKNTEFYGDEFPFMTPTDMDMNTRFIKCNNFLSSLGAEYMNSRLLPPDAVCFVCIGATIGKTCMTQEISYTNQQINSIVVNTEHHNPRFVYYLLTSERERIKKMAGGTATPIINKSVFSSAKLKVPTKDVQDKIGRTLSSYDDLTENNLRRIQILEELSRAIYREWFVHFRFPGHEEVEMVDSELGKIPDGWEVRKLSEIVSTQYGYTESANNEEVGPKFVRGMDINKTSYITWDTVPYCPIDTKSYEKYKLNEDDILVIRMADPGKVGIVEKEIDAVFASYLIRLKIEYDSVLPCFLFYTLSAERYQGFISGASTGTTRKSASAPLITNYDIAIPNRVLTNEFEIIVKSLRSLLNNLLDQNAVLERTRDLLLPRLVSGKIDVVNLGIDQDQIATHKTSKYEHGQPTLDQWLDGDEEDGRRK